jgi:diguanylate cyclase (GGDEF)-like protein
VRKRTHLRTRVLALTGAFAVVLVAITFGLSWRAKVSQERWSRLIGVETEAIATLEELIRAQNAFRGGQALRLSGQAGVPVVHYRVVTQLLHNESLATIDTTALRARMFEFESAPDDDTSAAVVREAQRIIEARKREIARALPELERDTHAMMASGLAVAWILVVLCFAGAQTTLRKVVRPLEELSASADRIAAGDLTARAPVAGDHEIYRLGTAFNRMADELKARARTDDLTALPNFRAFRERIDLEIERASRYPESFGMLVLDLDRFKKFNDTHGHLAGNDALQRVSCVIRETVRAVDFAARYGGEEFAVIVPEIDLASLSAIAERIRANVEALGDLTVSIGAALFPQDGKDAEALFNAADGRLYAAKSGGRNRVVVPRVYAEERSDEASGGTRIAAPNRQILR